MKPKKAKATYEKRKKQLENKVVHSIAEQRQIDAIFTTVLPQLRDDLAAGLDAKAIAQKYAALAQARVVTTAITGSEAMALTAAKDILDRSQGKATERKEITHAMANSSEDEIDAVIASKLTALEEAAADE